MTTLNIDTKSQLAKLIATENITVQQNNVTTASFDVVNRILTLPIFKTDSKDVTDMLIAHECAHALFTPTKSWKEITDDDELRSYINVLEDTRIDHLIQKKYPGVIKNYEMGFDILNAKNFFGIKDKNINNELMLIDKINLRSKSLNRLSFNFSNEDNKWLKKVDAIKSFKDVVKLAKEMLDWQNKQVDQMKKLPNFDELSIVKNYKLTNKKSDSSQPLDESVNLNDIDNENDTDKQDSKEEKTDSESKQDKPAVGDKTAKDDKGETKDGAVGAGGKGGLKSITNNWFEDKKEQLMDTVTSYNYKGIPEPKLSEVIHTSKQFVLDMKKSFAKEPDISKKYLPYLKTEYRKFLNDSKKTIMYLVKEFEMKKAATAYKRSTIDKTGIIDPLKLKNYKFSDDIFKRMTITPDAKNHGMIMLLDWSGSMSDCIFKTVQQLIQLVYFCQKTNIPFDVYFFTSEMSGDRYEKGNNKFFTYKVGDMALDSIKLVNVASSNLKKLQLDESMMYLYHLGLYYENRYCSYRNYDYSKPDAPMLPSEYYLGSTPLNEALIIMLKIIPQFKAKYRVEKMNFITLTDGGSNYSGHMIYGYDTESKTLTQVPSKGLNDVYIHNKKYYSTNEKNSYYTRNGATTILLTMIKKLTNSNIVGFYLVKKIRRWDTDQYFRPEDNKLSWDQKDKIYLKNRNEFTKNKVFATKQGGYDEYYIVNAKDMQVENADLSQVNGDMKAGKIRQLFSKSMKNRLTSRVLLNKFIKQVA